jgi:hypothetical protein
MSKILVGVVGPGDGAGAEETAAAFELGRLVAREGWVLVSGGRDAGVMDAASRGAKEAGGLTVGILPTTDAQGVSEAVDIAILTGMGQARNNVNILSSRIVFACGMGAGTASEIALALKARKQVILLHAGDEAEAFFNSLGRERVHVAMSPHEALTIARRFIDGRSI